MIRRKSFVFFDSVIIVDEKYHLSAKFFLFLSCMLYQAKEDPSLCIFIAVFLAFVSFFLPGVVIRIPRMATKMKGIYKSFKYISQIFGKQSN